MSESLPIHILELDPNEKGDLFTSLMTDLFISLGYEKVRTNIHKAGREIDVKAHHRIDGTMVVAECKATKQKSGGADLNKFFGVLDGERRTGKKPVKGYFISLSGFSESGEEMEREFTPERFTRLEGEDVISQLIEGRRLVSREEASEQAGRCVGNRKGIKLDRNFEVLVHRLGIFWALCYFEGGKRSYVVVISADGTPIRFNEAEEILSSNRRCGGDLDELFCLNPSGVRGLDPKRIGEAKIAWARYLNSECGSIQIEGISADQHVLERRFELEQLFIPQRLLFKYGELLSRWLMDYEEDKISHGIPINIVMSNVSRLSILAPPGGGKSTLLKRLAVAYSDPLRHPSGNDNLPERDWFPIFLRCRELRKLAGRPFGEIMEDLAKKPHLLGYTEEFLHIVHESLKSGKALLLVDGLDEISDVADRTTFVCTLRAAIDAWPKCSLIVTSREAGFRHIASHLAPFCTSSALAPFNSEDIDKLTSRWHAHMDGDSPLVRESAQLLSDKINSNERIRQLAINPLLLTTLFLVKRQTGDLPTGRAKLYAEAVKVLLWTWNIEGTTRIDPDDAIPRLAWVAHFMLTEGVQRISKSSLRLRLHEANAVLENVFGLRRLDPGDFIERIETRSSLLMMTGQDLEDNQLKEFYEFRHLTFQEYLAAVAAVEGYHQGRNDSDTLVTVLGEHVEKEKWREVIPLAAVLGGRQTSLLLRDLVSRLEEVQDDAHYDIPLLNIFCQCLADEAPASPALLTEASALLVRFGEWFESLTCEGQLWRSRYAEILRSKAWEICLDENDVCVGAPWMVASYTMVEVLGERSNYDGYPEAVMKARAMFSGENLLNVPEHGLRMQAALLVADICFETVGPHPKGELIAAEVEKCESEILRLCDSDRIWDNFAGLTCLYWMSQAGVAARAMTAFSDLSKNLLRRLCYLVLHSPHKEIREKAAAVISEFPLVVGVRGYLKFPITDDDLALLREGGEAWEYKGEALFKMLWFLGEASPGNLDMIKEAAQFINSDVEPKLRAELRGYIREHGFDPRSPEVIEWGGGVFLDDLPES
jgi:hypothetical protein